MGLPSMLQRPVSRLLRLARDELGLLLVVLALAGGLLGFASIADEMREGETHSFDRSMLPEIDAV